MCKKGAFVLFALLTLTACSGKNTTEANDSDPLAYSSEQAGYFRSSSAGTALDGKSSSSTEELDIIVMPPIQSSSSVTTLFENETGERFTCKGLYSHLTIQNVIYPEAYHCEDGNTCARHYVNACSETECESVIRFTCSDGSMSEEKFNKRYALETCKGSYCDVYCYNNEITLDDGDTLKIMDCDNGVSYLRDGAYDRKKAGKAIPDTLEDKPSLGYDFAVNCDYGEEICVEWTDEGRCFMSTNIIECPRKEQQD